MTARTLLRRARKHLEKSTWIKGEYGSPSGAKGRHEHCAYGAMRCVAGPLGDIAVRSDARSALGVLVGVNIIDWNDNVATSKRQVVAAMRKAARS